MDPESITLREISQVETDKSHVITFVRGTESKKQRMEQQTEIRTNKKSNSQIRKTMAVTRREVGCGWREYRGQIQGHERRPDFVWEARAGAWSCGILKLYIWNVYMLLTNVTPRHFLKASDFRVFLSQITYKCMKKTCSLIYVYEHRAIKV